MGPGGPAIAFRAGGFRRLFRRLRLTVLAHAQKSLLEFAVRFEPRRFHDPVDPAVDHDRHFFGDSGRNADVLLDNEDTDFALFAEVDQNLFNLFHNHRSQSLGRLVHNKEPWIEEEGAGNCEHLLLAAGKLVAAIGAPFRQSGESFVDA